MIDLILTNDERIPLLGLGGSIFLIGLIVGTSSIDDWLGISANCSMKKLVLK